MTERSPYAPAFVASLFMTAWMLIHWWAQERDYPDLLRATILCWIVTLILPTLHRMKHQKLNPPQHMRE